MRRSFAEVQSKFNQISKEFSDVRNQPKKDARLEIVNFLKDKFGQNTSSLSKVDTQKILAILEGDSEIVDQAKVYYCTQEGRVYGELQISKRKLFFEPLICPENNQFILKNQKDQKISYFGKLGSSKSLKTEEEPKHAQLKKFEVCIDIGDVISCNLRQFYNETGQYVSNLSEAKHYMYDFFL